MEEKAERTNNFGKHKLAIYYAIRHNKEDIERIDSKLDRINPELIEETREDVRDIKKAVGKLTTDVEVNKVKLGAIVAGISALVSAVISGVGEKIVQAIF